MQSGVDAGMTLAQMLAYTFLGAVLSDLLVVRSQASSWLYEGMFISLYQRPTGVILHLVSQTVGRWIPQLLFFTMPMLLAAPLFGVNLTPYSLWALPSLLLCTSLGFAVDLLFACVTIRLQNASWLVYVIRNAIQALFSGSVIPFALLPWGIGTVFQYIPFGSLAAAPLSIYTGLADAGPVIAMQVIWNLLLWPSAILAFSRSRERMVSYGG
jgi:ABC-2 type transport system permease protein